MRNLIIPFMSQGLDGLPATLGKTVGLANSTANQSSSSGCMGHSAWEPKFSEVFTIPNPNKRSQVRLTHTRAVKGCSPETSQRANPRRLTGSPSGKGGKTAGRARPTFSVGWSYSPRLRMKASLG